MLQINLPAPVVPTPANMNLKKLIVADMFSGHVRYMTIHLNYVLPSTPSSWQWILPLTCSELMHAACLANIVVLYSFM
jgi:hypothetical protein